MNESHAIDLCLKHRDPIGFEFLFKKYRRRGYFHAVAMLGNQEDAIDASQESFTRAFSAMPTLKGLDTFYPWFYRILRNCCLNMIDRRKTARRYNQQNASAEEGVSYADPEMLLQKSETQWTVWRALDGLKPEFREILVMKYIEGCRYEEISKLLAIPRGTVMSRLYHARNAFRHKYTRLSGRGAAKNGGHEHESV